MDNKDEKNITKFNRNIWKNIFLYFRFLKKWIIFSSISLIGLAFIDSFLPIVSKNVIDNFGVVGEFKGILNYIIIFVSLIILQGVLVILFISSSGIIETRLVYLIRKDAFEKIQKLSVSYFDKNAVGKIMSCVTADVAKLADIIGWSLMEMTWAIAFIIIVVINMFLINVKLSLIVIITMPIIVFVIRYFQRKILVEQRKVRKANSKIIGAINEGINGIKTTKTLVREEETLLEFKKLSLEMRDVSIRSFTISAFFTPVVIVLISISVGLILQQGSYGVLNNTVSFGTLTVFISYATLIFEPINNIADITSVLQSAEASGERIFKLINTEVEIYDKAEVIEKYKDFKDKDINGDIEFNKVSFKYKDGQKVLNNFNLKIKAGEKIALVGHTGAGKSTIVNLICRFYEPSFGVIKIDNIDYKELSLNFLQSNLGYVLQTPFFFSGTIFDNIRYGSLNATLDEVIEASKLAKAYDFIMDLPNTFDYIITEDGSNLSVGEKQLISFARAIIGNKKIIILDEATSYIDTITEQNIQSAIMNILKDRTSLIVAHRLSTIKICDRILVIENGEIVEEGNHTQLINKRGKYFQLYSNQFES